MDSIYKWALQCLRHHEGELVDDPDDPGQITNQGISLRFIQEAGIDFDGDGDSDADDIRNMTNEQAADTYKTEFWLPNKLDKISSEILAVKIFDMVVHAGSRQTWKLVQEALNKLGGNLVVDGVLGEKTLAAIAEWTDTDYTLLTVIRDRQHNFYERLIAQKPVLAKYRKGWRRRAAF